MWKFFKIMKGETEVFEELFCRHSGNLPIGSEVVFLQDPRWFFRLDTN